MIEAGGLVILFDRLFLIIGARLEPPSPSLLFTPLLYFSWYPVLKGTWYPVLKQLVPSTKVPGTQTQTWTWDLESWSCLEPQSAFDTLPWPFLPGSNFFSFSFFELQSAFDALPWPSLPGSNSHLGNCTPGKLL